MAGYAVRVMSSAARDRRNDRCSHARWRASIPSCFRHKTMRVWGWPVLTRSAAIQASLAPRSCSSAGRLRQPMRFRHLKMTTLKIKSSNDLAKALMVGASGFEPGRAA